MPKPIKIMLSILIAAIAFVLSLLGDSIGLGVGPAYLAPFAVFVILALWIFPEPTKNRLPRA